MTIFVVDRYTPGGTVRRRNVQGGNTTTWIAGLDSGARTVNVGGSVFSSSADPAAWGVTTVVADVDETVASLDGGVDGAVGTLPGNSEPGTLTIGGFLGPHGSMQASQVDVGEVLVFRRVLAADEVANVQAYLAYKWGVPLPPGAPVLPGTVAFATSDVYDTLLLQRHVRARAVRAFAFMRKTLQVDLQPSSLLSVTVRLNEAPTQWGLPVWLIISDAAAPVSVYDDCAVLGDNCGGRRLLRVCFNTDATLGACDEVSELPVGQWFTYTRNVAGGFASKYGSTGFTPSRVAITIATYAMESSSAVWVDDVSVMTFTAPATCASIRAESLATTSRWVNLPTDRLSAWHQRSSPLGGVAVTGLDATTDSGELVVSGTALGSDPSLRNLNGYYSQSFFEEKRIVAFETRIGAATVNDVAGVGARPALLFCDETVHLAPTVDGGWRYFLGQEAFAPPPPEPVFITVDDGAGPISSWTNDRTRVLPAGTIPWSAHSTYSLYVRVWGNSGQYGGVFFRGGNQEYALGDPAGTRITGSLDRAPAVYTYPHDTRLHIRVSTTSQFNNGCDPDDLLDTGAWTHVAILLEPKLMQVFYDGKLVCSHTYGISEELNVTPDRELGLVNHQSANGLVDVDEFRWYPAALSDVQIQEIINERRLIDPASGMSPGLSDWTKVECILSHSRVRVFENGFIKLDRVLPDDDRSSKSAESFQVSQNQGFPVQFDIRAVSVVEQKTVSRGGPIVFWRAS